MTKISKDYAFFLELALEKGTKTLCGAGSARFVIFPSGKITRCFGKTEPIGHITENSSEFIKKLSTNPVCYKPECFDPCDLDCSEKWIVETDLEYYFPIETPWAGGISIDQSAPEPIHHTEPICLDFIQINLTPTLLCNYTCSYCIAGANLVSPKVAAQTQLNPDDVILFLDTVQKDINPRKGILLYVSGGEPLIWTGIKPFFRYISNQNKIAVKLNSNCFHVNVLEEIIKLYRPEDAKRLFLQISVHIGEKNFSQAKFDTALSLLKEANIECSISVVGDKDGILSPEQTKFLSKYDGTTIKIYNDYRVQKVFDFKQIFVDDVSA